MLHQRIQPSAVVLFVLVTGFLDPRLADAADHPCAPAAYPNGHENEPKNTGFIEYWFYNAVPSALRTVFNQTVELNGSGVGWNDAVCNVGQNDFPYFRKSATHFVSGGYEASLDAFRFKV